MRIAVTGSGGFIGAPLVHLLERAGHDVVRPVRALQSTGHRAVGATIVRDTTSPQDWTDALGQPLDCIIHLIGRAHQLDDDADAFDLFWRDNVLVTRALIAALSPDNAPRFVFMSSVKAAAETTHGKPISDATVAAPTTHYGITKRAAELELMEWAIATDRQLTILRPPLVYGPHVRGNFLKLLVAADGGSPLPFGAVHNRRSVIFLSNLLNAVERAIKADSPGRICVPVADAQPMSVRDLIGLMRDGLGRPRRLIPVPSVILRAALNVVGRGDLASRLLDDLEIDNTAAKRLLGWSPETDTRGGLIATTRWYAEAIRQPRTRRRSKGRQRN